MACSNCNGKSHSHDHSAGFLGETELYFAILSGIFLIGGYLLHTFTDLSEITIIVIYAISYIFGGFFTLKEAIQEISHGRFEIDF